MLPDRVSNSGPLTYESGALPIALCGPALMTVTVTVETTAHNWTILYNSGTSIDQTGLGP